MSVRERYPSRLVYSAGLSSVWQEHRRLQSNPQCVMPASCMEEPARHGLRERVSGFLQASLHPPLLRGKTRTHCVVSVEFFFEGTSCRGGGRDHRCHQGSGSVSSPGSVNGTVDPFHVVLFVRLAWASLSEGEGMIRAEGGMSLSARYAVPCSRAGACGSHTAAVCGSDLIPFGQPGKARLCGAMLHQPMPIYSHGVSQDASRSGLVWHTNIAEAFRLPLSSLGVQCSRSQVGATSATPVRT
jgi:hypothetical protein